ncbi:hypothetical protein PV325_008456 [Microctonus aethiopoides]|nr:hypothetical protein PV325_008456 [Microctonus aethiopoides]
MIARASMLLDGSFLNTIGVNLFVEVIPLLFYGFLNFGVNLHSDFLHLDFQDHSLRVFQVWVRSSCVVEAVGCPYAGLSSKWHYDRYRSRL